MAEPVCKCLGKTNKYDQACRDMPYHVQNCIQKWFKHVDGNYYSKNVQY